VGDRRDEELARVLSVESGRLRVGESENLIEAGAARERSPYGMPWSCHVRFIWACDNSWLQKEFGIRVADYMAAGKAH